MTAGERGAPVEVLIRRLDEGLPLPAYAHPGDAGADLVTAVDVELAPGERSTVPTLETDRAGRYILVATGPQHERGEP